MARDTDERDGRDSGKTFVGIKRMNARTRKSDLNVWLCLAWSVNKDRWAIALFSCPGTCQAGHCQGT